METLAISMAGLCQLTHPVSEIKVLLITDYNKRLYSFSMHGIVYVSTTQCIYILIN